jgi:hypothetical protein
LSTPSRAAGPGGLAVALAAIPAVLLADWLYKIARHRRAVKAEPATKVQRL